MTSEHTTPEQDFLHREVTLGFVTRLELVLALAIAGEETPVGHFKLKVSDVMDLLNEYIDQQQATINERRSEQRDAAFDRAFGVLPQEIKSPSIKKALAAKLLWGNVPQALGEPS